MNIYASLQLPDFFSILKRSFSILFSSILCSVSYFSACFSTDLSDYPDLKNTICPNNNSTGIVPIVAKAQ